MSIYLFIYLLLFQCRTTIMQNAKKVNENVQMQVRAVFINCELNENDSTLPQSENTRFTQEELFRHGSLTNCNKKLALTVKLTGETDVSATSSNFGDEYVPIEHVMNGPSKRRTRLLNPYVLRLRREQPLQAYELRKIDTVNGIFTNIDYEKDGNFNNKRQIGKQGNFNWYQNDDRKNTENRDAIGIKRLQMEHNIMPSETYFNTKQIGPEAFIQNGNVLSNSSFKNRFKRQDYKDDAQKKFEDGNQMWIVTDNTIDDLNKFQQPIYDNGNNIYGTPVDYSYSYSKINKDQEQKGPRSIKSGRNAVPKQILLLDKKIKKDFSNKYDNFTSLDSQLVVKPTEAINNNDIEEKPYALYEIGSPDMWSTVHVQLFEKVNAPNGQTVLHDITNGELASVSSTVPDWGNENMNVRYQSTEWVARDDFTFPKTGFCLLTPIQDPDENHLVEDITFINGQKYFVLPTDAIITLEDSSSLSKRSENDSNISHTKQSIRNEQFRRRVQIRLSRAIFSGNDEKMSITSRGKDRFLTIPYRRSSRGQIDLEAKADENQLVTVGSSARITTVVSDSSRPTSTTLTIQTANNGLAAARFRAVVRSCYPTLKSEFVNKDSEEIITDRVLIPPKQTRMLKLHISNEVPVDSSHCSVALLNDFDEQVAFRDVTIRKGDRCFCVWHCDCVCLSEDPKLLCREMPLSHQIAAGLSSHKRKRHARSVCYNDIVSIDMCVIIIGVIMALLLLGFVKALIGLFVPSIRNWGLDRVLQTPRKLDHYYEDSLRSRPVVYDAEGWPVHPDTKKRTIHIVSRSMEFILNVIYFVVAPCLVVRHAIKIIVRHCKGRRNDEPGKSCPKDTKKCYSSQDMQSVVPRWRQRRGGLRRWMTPQAEEVSADLWRKALPSQQPIKCEFMQPLLHEQHYKTDGVLECQDSCVDSEEEDTKYVLMQMQKSKESLRRSQRKLNESEDLPKKYTKSRDLNK